MLHLALISGTDRPGAKALSISRYLKKRYEQEGCVVSLINMQEFPLQAVQGGKYGQDIPEIQPFIDTILESDGIVMVIPEYNGTYPGILKLFIDYLPFPEAFSKKPISYIGEAAGAFGGLRAVEQMEQVASYRYAYNFNERVFINRVHKTFSEEGGISDDFQQQLLDSQIANFPVFVQKVKEENLQDSIG